MSETEEDKATLEFTEKLAALAKEYGVRDAAFCGSLGSRFYATFVGATDMTAAELMQSTVNVGRLWQYAREQTRRFLNRFEKDVWSQTR